MSKNLLIKLLLEIAKKLPRNPQSNDKNYNEMEWRVDAFSPVCRPIYFISLPSPCLCLHRHLRGILHFLQVTTEE